MKTFTLIIDEHMNETLTTLARDLKHSKASVLRSAVAAYELVVDVIREGNVVASVDRKDKKLLSILTFLELERLRPRGKDGE